MAPATRHLFLLLNLALAPFLRAQTTPHDLVQQALAAEQQAKASLERFTCFDLEHTQNRNQNGKLFFDRSTLYEQTFIADLPYRRVVEIDGKPLAGKDLEKEQARYDQAISARKGLDEAARAALLHQKLVKAALRLEDTLTPAYRLTELRQESLAGQPTHVIEAVPVGGSSLPTPTKRIQLWITETDPTIVHLTFDVLADEPEMLRGSHGEEDFQRIDGVPVPQHQLFHSFYPHGDKPITVDTEHTFTRYRRFTTATRILSTTEVSEPEPK